MKTETVRLCAEMTARQQLSALGQVNDDVQQLLDELANTPDGDLVIKTTTRKAKAAPVVEAPVDAPAEAPAPGAASQDTFDTRFERAATFLDNIEPLMRLERSTLEIAASEEPTSGDLDSVSQVLSSAPVMTTDSTTAPYVPLSATLGDVFGHIDVALVALGRLAPASVLLDPEIRSNLANLATPELRLQAASDYLTRLRAECREANSKKRPLTRASAGASSDASRDTSPAPPAKK